MREYHTAVQEKQELSRILCNGCGREIPLQQEDCFHGEKIWGYFSEKDGRADCFDLCEQCYDKLTDGFRIKIK